MKTLLLLIKKTICLVLTKIEQSFRIKPSMITILIYHSISGDNTAVDVSPSDFSFQIEFLKSKFDFITLDKVVDYIQGKTKISKPSVALTFDDGYADLFKHAVPLLAKKNIPATVFVLADPLYANRVELNNNKPLLTFSQIKKLQSLGWAIGCHGATHANFYSDITDFKKEIIFAKKILENQLKTKVDFFAYPKGIYNKKVIKFIKAKDYKAAFSINPGIISTKTNLYKIPRMGVDRTFSQTEFPFLLTKWAIIYFCIKDLIGIII